MLERFFKDSAIYAMASLITGSLSILLLPYLARQLSIQQYGVMDLLLSTINIINIIVPLSISQALGRYYPILNTAEQPAYASTGLWFTCITYGLFLFGSLLFIHTWTLLLIGDSQYSQTTSITFLSMFMYGIFFYLQVQLRWMLKPILYLVSNIIFVAITCLLTVLFIHYFQANVDGFFLARIVGCLFASIFCWHYSKQNYRWVLDFTILKKMLSFSSPLVISSIGIFVSLYIDRFIIRSTLSLTDLGIYSACARVASIAGSIMTVMNFALTPLIYSRYQESKTPSHLAFLFKIIIYGMSATIIFLLLFSKQLLTLLIGAKYSAGCYVLPLLVTSFIMSGLYNCAPGLWIANKTKVIAIINILSALVNTALCLILVPLLGYLGAAIATCLSTIATLIISTRYAQKHYFISYDWFKINITILITLIFSFLIVYN